MIIGQEHLVERLLVGLLTGGHILLEGLPGQAKTLAVKTLAMAVHSDFRRIQFTPDMLPADILDPNAGAVSRSCALIGAADCAVLRRCTRSRRGRNASRNNRQSARARFPRPAPLAGATRTRDSRPAESTSAFW